MQDNSAGKVWEKITKFYESGPRNFSRIQNVSLVPLNDPSLLFVNSGMFPLVPYLAGEKHPQGTRLYNKQRCVRTAVKDTSEIGDSYHLTCFNMIGNWSLGDYFKAEQIPWIAELYLDVLGFDIDKFYVSVFKGDKDAPKDQESIDLWLNEFKKRGISNPLITDNPTDINLNYDDNGNLINIQNPFKIFLYGKDECWWQRGDKPGELGGPCSEMFFDIGINAVRGKQENLPFHDQGERFVELGNNVFIEYFLNDKLEWDKLDQRNVDFGGGYERIISTLQGKTDIYESELFLPILNKISEQTNVNYEDLTEIQKSPYRIIADHARAAVLIISDGVTPGNKEQGYILRSLIRRALNQADKLNLKKGTLADLSETVIEVLYKIQDYEYLSDKKDFVYQVLNNEEEKFTKTIQDGRKEIAKLINRIKHENRVYNGEDAFYIYESFGLPLDLQIDELEQNSLEFNLESLSNEFDKFKRDHQIRSRKGAEKIFKGGLADTSEITTAYHTATHILLVALNKILQPENEIVQKGSNITSDRLRFDFNYPNQITEEQISLLNKYINEKINENLEVSFEEMPKEEAIAQGVKGQFDNKYGDVVKVYKIQDSKTQQIESVEYCGGPHVKNTSEISKIGRFEISKIKSIGNGIKRVRGSFVS